MDNAALLIDGGYFLKRRPIVRPDIDSAVPESANISPVLAMAGL